MTKKQKAEWAINKAVSVLTYENGINIFDIQKLSAKLKANPDDVAMIIASDCSPEGRITWQDYLALDKPLNANYIGQEILEA